MPLNAKLVVVGGDVKTAEIKLRLPSTVGRGRGTTIMLPHPLVSRQHCELFEMNGQLMVRDLGSLNGTFVNNQRVTESPLPPGELLTIGTVTFRAMYESQPESQPPAGAGPQVKTRRNETDAVPAAGQTQPTEQAPDVVEVEVVFDKPPVPVDDSSVPPPSHALRGTKRIETTLEDAPSLAKTTPASSAKTTPAPPPKPAAKPGPPAKPAPPAVSKDTQKGPAPAARPAAPAAPAKGAAKVYFSKGKNDSDAEVPVKTDEDDDLGEFLKRLKK
jgi:predicted component of type VI protein secretion system